DLFSLLGVILDTTTPTQLLAVGRWLEAKHQWLPLCWRLARQGHTRSHPEHGRKPVSADGTAIARSWESRPPPALHYGTTSSKDVAQERNTQAPRETVPRFCVTPLCYVCA